LASHCGWHNVIFTSRYDFYSSSSKASSQRYNIWGSKEIMKQENKSLLRRIFRRGIWENFSTALILIGVFMLMQPFAMWMYTYSFIVILIGTIGFVITSHFPD
jgi:hypothetical protein